MTLVYVLGFLVSNTGTLLILFLVLLLSFTFLKSKPKNLPPGPPVLPIIGSLPFLGAPEEMLETMSKMAERYGEVFSFYMGNQLVVVLHGYKAISEALLGDNKDLFSGRPTLYCLELLGHHPDQGLGMADGDIWKEHRRFALRAFRNLGVGKTRVEEIILSESCKLLRLLEKTQGTPFDPRQLLDKLAFNVISTVVLGKPPPDNDSHTQNYIIAVNDVFHNFGFSATINYIPLLRYLPGDFFHIKTTVEKYKIMVLSYLERKIKDHRETFDPKNITDVIDAFLKEQQQNNSETEYWTETQANITLADLMVAGYETAATTFTWALLYMVVNPEIQAKVQHEIDDVIGRVKLPRIADRQHMPYTDACTQEILRHSNTVPVATPHATTGNVEFRGYMIPKGATVWPLISSAHSDKDYFDQPEKFDPTRFLSDSGNVKIAKGYIPFGIGPRKCAGEALARMQFFLVFSSLLQKFSFTLPEGATFPDIKGVLGITLAPQPFKLCAHERP